MIFFIIPLRNFTSLLFIRCTYTEGNIWFKDYARFNAFGVSNKWIWNSLFAKKKNQTKTTTTTTTKHKKTHTKARIQKIEEKR